MFIGRKQEIRFLENKYKEEGGQLIVLYGRRRIGKTELLKEFCKEKQHVFFSCVEEGDAWQLKKFSSLMFKEDIPIKRYINEFSDWSQAFESVLDLPYQDKKLLIIDEFPYLVKSNPSIPSILQSLWDHQLKDQNIMIILCGSAMSFIEKEILSSKNPLYGRATGIYKMDELSFYEAIQFFPNYTNKDKVLAYSILGGIPHYLKQFNPNQSLEENIKNKIMTKGSPLYSEVEFLLRQELREIPIYNQIITAISAGNTKLNEISTNALLNDSSKTNVYLKNLIELGLVEKKNSIDAGIKEITNNSRGRYTVKDHFFKFWYTFIMPNMSFVEMGDIDGIYEFLVAPYLNQFASFTFEEVCIQYLYRQQLQRKLPFWLEKLGNWYGKTKINGQMVETEIDIFGFSKQQYLIGECKFKNSSFAYTDYLKTKRKVENLINKYDVYFYLFSLSGFEENLINEQSSHLILVNLDEMI